ncbi:hypothetical protein GCM10010106_18370 [Thermopolyspora flexuosa]|uniref:ABC-2 family transporter n=1 Tax=Thermopolyspora flexuosa TaxID=103836 RepID=A0A543J409_9ACTN|nr:ABC transporter permease [Thermopolyspora flexuosa]TQM77576.1 ABC-2 family transporter [Thermopolyspora flexuosa]GGM72350.1 hypothetical protein GCM10010106_18370 [Thermopolyspora flexuosa]
MKTVFTVRREQHIHKRLRVGGVAVGAVLAAVCAPTLAFVLIVTVVLCAIGVAAAGVYPAAPELLLLAGILASITMSLLGVWITRFARTAESIQLIGFIPLFLLVFGSGAMIPLEFMADRFAQVVWFSPLAPLVDLFRAAYFGADFFGGRVTQVPPLDRLELWTAALPALGVSLAWALISCHLVRSVPWTARRT